MTDSLPPLPTPTPVLRLEPGHLYQVLQGIQPGWYRTQDLYPRYVAWSEREGLPVYSPKRLGETIRRVLKPERAGGHGHVALFRLDEVTIQRAAPDTAPSTGQPG